MPCVYGEDGKPVVLTTWTCHWDFRKDEVTLRDRSGGRCYKCESDQRRCRRESVAYFHYMRYTFMRVTSDMHKNGGTPLSICRDIYNKLFTDVLIKMCAWCGVELVGVAGCFASVSIDRLHERIKVLLERRGSIMFCGVRGMS